MYSKLKNSNRIIIAAVILITLITGILLLRNWEAVGTSLANPMRRLIGVRAVAQLETMLFNLQDGIKQWEYNLGLAEAESPWESPPDLANLPQANSTPTRIPQSKATTAPPTAAPIITETGATVVQQTTEPSPIPTILTPIPTDQPTPLPTTWALTDLKPFGEVINEGVWQPYIYSPDGKLIAVRTFLQPDPERPYALVAIAAFDLNNVNLHYVLGLKEPAKPGGPHGWGLIPEEDKQPGKLLAAFNGGFIFEHGNYGAMADRIYPIALRHGLATLAIYEDGAVRIGEWGTDLQEGENHTALRQNALPIIHNGEINPKVYTGTWVEWGANLDYSTVTLRSGVGLSGDNRVLYYFAGPSLSMPVLADAMAAAGVHNSMLLDINPTHAHFTAMRVVDGQLTAEPLYEEEMNLWVDRYLRQWDLDFFYLTVKE